MTSRRTILAGLLVAGSIAPFITQVRAEASPATDAAPDAPMNTQPFEFVSGGNRLSGFIDIPADGIAHAMILIIHGYGATDVAGRTSYYDLRSHFAGLGVSTIIWDKPGCGKSAGTFDIDQSVESSATEVLDAIRHATESRLPGTQKIGLWGISRGGWIAPIAITKDPRIGFWISVSGTDDEENFPYLLDANLRIEGRPEKEITALVGEWRRGFAILSHGGTYQDYLTATQKLRRDPFMMYLSAGEGDDEASFHRQQKPFLSGDMRIDEKTGLQIYVSHFQSMLARLNIPVLAVFGEKDRNVNWRSTSALYSRTIGKNPRARLTIRTFPDGNHNIQQARTGGLREMIEMKDRHLCDGYFEAMENWLRTEVLI